MSARRDLIPNMLIAKNITKTINNRKILDNISLSLNKGEIISIIGPSGAGKTALLKAISLIDPPTSGTLKINNENYNFPLKEQTKINFPYPSLTVVFQQLYIWPHLTIRQNLTLPLKGNINQKHFDELITLFDMRSFLERFPNEVSLGQRQRAALARALLLNPEYLLLDEVTSALDIEQSHNILKYLRNLADRGTSIIFISHSLQFVKKISNKVIFIDKGKIIEFGTTAILSHPRTERLKKFIVLN